MNTLNENIKRAERVETILGLQSGQLLGYLTDGDAKSLKAFRKFEIKADKAEKEAGK